MHITPEVDYSVQRDTSAYMILTNHARRRVQLCARKEEYTTINIILATCRMLQARALRFWRCEHCYISTARRIAVPLVHRESLDSIRIRIAANTTMLDVYSITNGLCSLGCSGDTLDEQ